jgi:hypothetical protein
MRKKGRKRKRFRITRVMLGLQEESQKKREKSGRSRSKRTGENAKKIKRGRMKIWKSVK